MTVGAPCQGQRGDREGRAEHRDGESCSLHRVHDGAPRTVKTHLVAVAVLGLAACGDAVKPESDSRLRHGNRRRERGRLDRGRHASRFRDFDSDRAAAWCRRVTARRVQVFRNVRLTAAALAGHCEDYGRRNDQTAPEKETATAASAANDRAAKIAPAPMLAQPHNAQRQSGCMKPILGRVSASRSSGSSGRFAVKLLYSGEAVSLLSPDFVFKSCHAGVAQLG
jgi:hypothetical protein